MPQLTRRNILSGAASAALVPGTQPLARPNIVIVIADQVRYDAIGAYGQLPIDLTPNIDALARSGTLYRHAFIAQPVCSPSRASMFTGQYPARHGVWRNIGNGVALNPATPTIATELTKLGYSANYIGKWHLADGPAGPVAASARGGFLGLWEASNELEHTSHPYEGELFDGDGRPIPFKDQYRVDFMTGRAKRFLQNASKTNPFLLCVSFLEPHHQNDLGRMVAPKGMAEKYKNPFVSPELRSFKGDFLEQLPDYYGCISSIDSAVGEIVRSVPDNTIVVFLSDHGCHFKTRNTEYKRSGHDSSIRIPLIISGPSFSGGHEIQSFTSTVDLMPMLLKAAGAPVPSSCQLSTVSDEIFVQMSEFWTARALRTPEFTYVVAAPRTAGQKYVAAPNSPRYNAFQLYDNRADPHQLVNLCGRQETASIELKLRERLLARMAEAGDPPAEILPTPFPYC